jgi:quinohemoprotein ethanol dehydrogenase
MHRSEWTFSLALILVACTAAPASGQQLRKVDDAALKAAATKGEDWLTYGQNAAETRYSPLKQIDTTNVNRLGLAWSYELGSGGGNQEATPLVFNNTIYGITNWSVVFAVDARTGKEKWRWDPEVNRAAVMPKICCGVVHRGVAAYQNLIIAPIIDGRLQALDAESGKPVWEARVAFSQENYTITMAPRIAKGKVIIGVSGSEFPVRGFFAAFDAATGKPAWKFYTVPGDPAKGFENEAMRKAAATWEGEWWKMGGGATVWDGMAYDAEENLVYVGTGNAGPWPSALRGKEDRDNLYACSIIAVNADTGEMKWYFQMVPGDTWDYDSVQQLMLAEITVKGQRRKVIMQANKNGFYYVVDRTNGKFISGQAFAQVTWARGLNEETGRPIVNSEARFRFDVITLAPGPGGAHNWSPMSFHPGTGLIYIPTSAGSTYDYMADKDFVFKEGQQNMGIVRPGTQQTTAAAGDAANAAAAAAPAKKLPPPPAIGPEPPPPGQRGLLVAWDPATQKERWRATGGGSIGGGTVATAGNLVFQVIPDGHLVAYSADKGEKLLDVQTGLRGGMGPPITYMIDGKQYVSVMGGRGSVVRAPGAPGPNTPEATMPPRLLVFMIDGKAALPKVDSQASR